ncbi:hypothetical protein SAMN04487917_10612 [Arthrobacter sp. yr096]|uniref:hypothetical protein n=1 Tax=unclassified Arthrobacter TaxID=235627 RepID=UPI000899B23A|nr:MULTISPECIES: hypothetical protein [unclassified Arthrobacter]SDX46940.1 hypothetical protein SAMN04487912_11351 [Arthrobacter sp. cf158]SEJ45705.1 hypothetical protein SAMN04487917_10612 [Arthrobacter sp. yr096]
MPNFSDQDTLRVTTQATEDATLTLEASKPVTLRIEVDRCPCGSDHRTGSYVDSDFSR